MRIETLFLTGGVGTAVECRLYFFLELCFVDVRVREIWSLVGMVRQSNSGPVSIVRIMRVDVRLRGGKKYASVVYFCLVRGNQDNVPCERNDIKNATCYPSNLWITI